LYTLELDASYKISPKFTLSTGVDIIGSRWIQDSGLPDGMFKLKPMADVNLKLNYQYSKVFSLFADFYNLADRSYMIWNQYPSQRFNFLFGFSYKL
jgi:outer membrane receptor protein involved in Fe transport